MLTDALTVGSDDWWLMRLATNMGAGFPRLFSLKRHRDGDALIPEEATPAMREAYLAAAKQGRLVMTDLIVKAKTNRQRAIGFRTAAAGDEIGDDLAWKNWKNSQMTVGSRRLNDDVGHYGAGYIVVTGSTLGTGPQFEGKVDQPLMVPRNGWTTFTQQYVDTPWLAEAGITIGYDPVLGGDTIILYRPGYIRTAVKIADKTTIPNNGEIWNPGTEWTWVTGPVSLGYTTDVPIVRLGTLDGFGLYEKHLDTIDRINDVIKQRSTIIRMQAFRQRAVQGDFPTVYPPEHERAGETIDYDELFKAGPAALWFIPNGAEIWESAVTDITPVLAANDKDIKHLAAVTSTPLYVLSPDAAAGSAAGAELSERMLLFTINELNELADAAFAIALGLCFQAQRDAVRADPSTIETIWASVSMATMAAKAAAAPQAKAGGMPQRFIDEKVFEFTPAEIRQARQDREDEAFDAATPAVDEAALQDPEPGSALADEPEPEVEPEVVPTKAAAKPKPKPRPAKAVA